jgi:large subunit ribosomal protein L3
MMNSNLSEDEARKIIDEELAKMAKEKADKVVKDWKPGQRKRPLMITYRLEDFEYELDPDAPPKWTNRDKRCGALAIKVGMMPVWDEWGERHPCTVLWMDRNIVLGHKTPEQHGYLAVQVAAGERKSKRVPRVVLGQYQHLPKLQELPPYMVREFRITDQEHLVPVGSPIHASHFIPGQNLDIAGITKGKGFQGPMKRHHFSGMPATHGNSKTHRAHGATGSRQDPGKVFKGKKMAGHMGVERRTIQNLRLVKVDRGRNLLFVRGAVPGNKGCFVEIRDAVKRPLWNSNLVLDKVEKPPIPTAKYDPKVDGSGKRGKEVFMPMLQQDPLNPTAPPGEMMKATAVAAAAAAAAKSSN